MNSGIVLRMEKLYRILCCMSKYRNCILPMYIYGIPVQIRVRTALVHGTSTLLAFPLLCFQNTIQHTVYLQDTTGIRTADQVY